MRVYLPATWPTLAALVADGRWVAVSVTAYAVTPALRESYADGDLDALEYAALTDAARASLRLVAAAGGRIPRRRVVVAAEVAERSARPEPDTGRAAVRLTATIPLARIAAVHVDEPAAAQAVQAAMEALPAADAGSASAAEVVGDVEGYDLLWYATQEIADLAEGT